jgi:hypothetical protein
MKHTDGAFFKYLAFSVQNTVPTCLRYNESLERSVSSSNHLSLRGCACYYHFGSRHAICLSSPDRINKNRSDEPHLIHTNNLRSSSHAELSSPSHSYSSHHVCSPTIRRGDSRQARCLARQERPSIERREAGRCAGGG